MWLQCLEATVCQALLHPWLPDWSFPEAPCCALLVFSCVSTLLWVQQVTLVVWLWHSWPHCGFCDGKRWCVCWGGGQQQRSSLACLAWHLFSVEKFVHMCFKGGAILVVCCLKETRGLQMQTNVFYADSSHVCWIFLTFSSCLTAGSHW